MFVHRLKLRPPQLLPLWIERDAIERRFHRGVRVFSIVAGAGYGKTVSAARLFASDDRPKFWYALDAADGDLAVFARHLEAMLDDVPGVRDFGGEAWRLGAPREVGANFAERLADVSPPPLVVFDDVHAIVDTRSATALAAIVERGVRAGATFVLAGRAMPVALHQVAASALYAGVTAADLAFEPAEVERYFEHVGRDRMLGSGPRAMIDMAEGWPAGLALIASSSPERAATQMGVRHGYETRRLLFDYLATEVLAALGDDERRLLLDTAVLDELVAAHCDAVTETRGSGERLASLAERGLFVTRRGEDAYSCHQLFREFLLDHLKIVVGNAGIAALHRRAARVLEGAGQLASAIEHLIRAGDLDEAAIRLESTARAMVQEGRISTVASMLAALGAQRVEERPRLLMALGRVHREGHRLDDAQRALERAMTLARARGEHDLYAEALRFWSPIVASRGELERLEASIEEALTLDPPVSDATADALRITLGAVFLERGRFDEVLALYRDVMPRIVALGDDASYGVMLNNVAVAHFRRGDPYASIPSYERAITVKYAAGQRISALTTLGNLVLARRVVGDVDEAERLVERLLAEAQDVGVSGTVANALESQGALRFDRGDVSGAEAAFRAALATIDAADVLARPDIVLGLARCAAATERFDLALERCDEAILAMRAAGRVEERAPAEILRASVLAALGDSARAFEAVRGALALLAGGRDVVNVATSSLDAAVVLQRIGGRLGPAGAAAEALLGDALRTAARLVHERGYRFLLRTRGDAFASLRPSLDRFGLGATLGSGTAEAAIPRSPLRIELLGGLRIERDGDPVPEAAWKRRRARDIFAQLVSLRGRPVPRTRLVDCYWPDMDADAANDNLRVTITAIRKAVGDVVKFEASGYRFVAPAGTHVDVADFDERIERARAAANRGDEGEVVAAFRGAIGVYAGDFLDGMDDGGWQWQERERLRAAHLEAIRAVLASGRSAEDERRALIDRLLAAAPFDPAAVRLRLDDLVARGRGAEARREYAAWRARYAVTVGAPPGEIWSPAVPELSPPVRKMRARP